MEKSSLEGVECKMYGFTAPNGVISIVANCPGISGTVPDFLPVSRKGPENLF